MRIGVDIDGVLTDLEGFLHDYAIDFYKSKGIELLDPKGYDVKGMFGISKDLVYDFWFEYLPKYFSMPPRVKAAEIIKKLQNEGNYIIIISARGSGKDEDTLGKEYTKFVTDKWLSMHGINADIILYTDGRKLDTCEKYQIDIMIDDMPYNLLEVSSKIKCICYNAVYNEDINNDNIVRCYDWDDIYNKVHEMC